MDELKLMPTQAQVAQRSLGQWLQSLRVGQVLRAAVVDKAPDGVLIRAAGHLVSASTAVPMDKGATLTLEVTGLSPSPSLKVIPPTGQAVADPLVANLKQLVSTQGRVLAPLLSLLSAGESANILSLLGLGRKDLDGMLKVPEPGRAPLDAQAIRQGVQQSGLFFEANLRTLLSSGGGLPAADLKGLLFLLLGRLDQAGQRLRSTRGGQSDAGVLEVLRDELEGALATISLKQLAARRADEQGLRSWVFDLPFRFGDELHSVSLQVESGGGAVDDSPQRQDWKVLVSLEIAPLGLVEAELFLYRSTVSVVLYADRYETANLISANLSQLEAGLQTGGLSVSVLRCHQGSREGAGSALQRESYLDEKI